MISWCPHRIQKAAQLGNIKTLWSIPLLGVRIENLELSVFLHLPDPGIGLSGAKKGCKRLWRLKRAQPDFNKYKVHIRTVALRSELCWKNFQSELSEFQNPSKSIQILDWLVRSAHETSSFNAWFCGSIISGKRLLLVTSTWSLQCIPPDDSKTEQNMDLLCGSNIQGICDVCDIPGAKARHSQYWSHPRATFEGSFVIINQLGHNSWKAKLGRKQISRQRGQAGGN